MGTDPFTKTWWFLEARDGSWLADDKHELFTRDPNAAMKWPNKTHAGWAMARLHNALWIKIEGPTEHSFIEPAPAEARSEQAGWRPIETAPKDGTAIVCAARYDFAAKWVFWTDYWRTYASGLEGFGQPRSTHWMPLPAPTRGEAP